MTCKLQDLNKACRLFPRHHSVIKLHSVLITLSLLLQPKLVCYTSKTKRFLSVISSVLHPCNPTELIMIIYSKDKEERLSKNCMCYDLSIYKALQFNTNWMAEWFSPHKDRKSLNKDIYWLPARFPFGEWHIIMWLGLPEENEGVRGAAHWRQREKKKQWGAGEGDCEGWGDFVTEKERARQCGRTEWRLGSDVDVFVEVRGGTAVRGHGEGLTEGPPRDNWVWRVIAVSGAAPADTDRLSVSPALRSLGTRRDSAASLDASQR